MINPYEVLPLDEEELKTVAAGEDFQRLKTSMGYIRLMQVLKDWELSALSDMRSLKTPTPEQSQSALLKWSERSLLIGMIEMLIENTITSMKELKGESVI